MLSGCATVRPVPTGNQPLAQATAAGVVVSVPRLDSGDYPGDVLDVANAVLVIIENQGQSEILIDPEGFLLGPAGGMQMSPIAPQQLAEKSRPAAQPLEELADGRPMLAWRGGGSFRLSAPAPRFSGPSIAPRVGGSVRVAPPHYGGGYRGYVPPYRGGSYAPRSYYYGQSRWGFWAGGPLYWGPSWSVGWYGSPLFWPWFYDGPRAYAWSRADAMRMALPAGRLPAGGRTGGFLYYPRIENADGVPLTLQWTVRDAATQQPLGTIQLPFEMRGD
jgi:hypothetical protein